MKHNQRGVYSVEFAVVGTVFFLVLFSVFEVGRLFFTWNVITEASRRVARLVVVCDFDQENQLADNNAIIYAVTDLMPLIPNFSAANIAVSYLTEEGATATSYGQIDLVRAEIINYQHDFLVPGLALTLNSPNFASTLPRESLGVTRWGYTVCDGS
ncbi:pilus assembly protein [Alteromonas sp. ASW11-19]|uniref:Pilus assembly protein n=1 Tax=Alteromonas salexigens TaxID=2982530 RepID=A0ABT2VNJ3_9ALTE|nr:TadE/TadG family type IV pilus assembly protein [Alteromonas salexigens]MCU7554871.1 pilus assembly protein [Alteromonas salexigens]